MYLHEVFVVLKQKMQDDPSYAWSWHCNIAMAMYDAGCDHKIANEGAARFMQLCFEMDTTQCLEYQSIMRHYDDVL